MKVGIIVFAYNRSWHLQQVLGGLQKNSNVKKLYIFQDGLKCEEHRLEWEATKKVIKEIAWCETIYELSPNNKGLAKSIVYGINKVFKENDAVIVLEDDCVPTSNFIDFMLQCFVKYIDNKNVYCISGYSWPIGVEKEKYDVYFTGRVSTWGWGTWKERWEQYEIDNHILDRIKNDKDKSLYLAKWGSDLEKMFIDRVMGKNDSWAIYWALKVIELDGICIAPYVSLIQNIGCDGSGVHCGKTDRYQTLLEKDAKREYNLPDKITFSENICKSFATLYGSYTGANTDDTKMHVLVYGLGNYFLQNERYINDNYFIDAFIDKAKQGYFAGKKIISAEEIRQYNNCQIIIMIRDIQECLKVARGLTYKYHICHKNVLLGIGMMSNDYGIKGIAYTEDDKLEMHVDGIRCKVSSVDEFNNVWEVLVNKNYNYFVNNAKMDVVIDIGMNIGDATLFFLNRKKTKKVYGFEPFKQTYLSAKENLKEYINDKDRLEIFQFGISNQNEQRNILYNREMSCGQSTLSTAMETARNTYKRADLISEENDVLETIEVKRATEILRPIIEKHVQDNLILKLDCEGDEYGIMQDLLRERLLSNFDFIMLEWHYQGKTILLNYLKEAGFSYWCNDKSEKMGLIYAYK